jgi:hypothetical protein
MNANDNVATRGMVRIPIVGEVGEDGEVSFYGRATGEIEVPAAAMRLAFAARARRLTGRE